MRREDSFAQMVGKLPHCSVAGVAAQIYSVPVAVDNSAAFATRRQCIYKYRLAIGIKSSVGKQTVKFAPQRIAKPASICRLPKYLMFTQVYSQ